MSALITLRSDFKGVQLRGLVKRTKRAPPGGAGFWRWRPSMTARRARRLRRSAGWGLRSSATGCCASTRTAPKTAGLSARYDECGGEQ